MSSGSLSRSLSRDDMELEKSTSARFPSHPIHPTIFEKPTSSFLAASTIRAHYFPPSIVPTADIIDFTISTHGHVSIKLASPHERELGGRPFRYRTSITAKLRLGRLTKVKGIQCKSSLSLWLPVDSITIKFCHTAGNTDLVCFHSGPFTVSIPTVDCCEPTAPSKDTPCGRRDGPLQSVSWRITGASMARGKESASMNRGNESEEAMGKILSRHRSQTQADDARLRSLTEVDDALGCSDVSSELGSHVCSMGLGSPEDTISRSSSFGSGRSDVAQGCSIGGVAVFSLRSTLLRLKA